MKTVRFTAVVERCARPQVHVLWTAPEKDREFQRALKAHRVMTVAPPAPGRAEVGHVGFDPKQPRGAELLVFPKSLKRFADARIVGIKFDLVEQPAIVAAQPHEGWTKRRNGRRKTAAHACEPNRTSVAAFAPPTAPETASPPARSRRHIGWPQVDRGPTPTLSPSTEHRRYTQPPPSRPPPRTPRPQPSRGAKQRPPHHGSISATAPEHSASTTPLEALTAAARTALAELERGQAGDAYATLKRALG